MRREGRRRGGVWAGSVPHRLLLLSNGSLCARSRALGPPRTENLVLLSAVSTRRRVSTRIPPIGWGHSTNRVSCCVCPALITHTARNRDERSSVSLSLILNFTNFHQASVFVVFVTVSTAPCPSPEDGLLETSRLLLLSTFTFRRAGSARCFHGMTCPGRCGTSRHITRTCSLGSARFV